MMFGRRFPRWLFRMTEDSLICNDPYVPERMLAACYGAAMALHCRLKMDKFRDELLPKFARQIFAHMFAEKAPFSTTHALRRDYARWIIELALHCHPSVLSPEEKTRIRPPFTGGLRKWRRRPDYDEGRYREGNAPLGFDWNNYTLGDLVPGRATYDFNHPGYVEVREDVLWRIHDLGYSLERFGDIDKSIARQRFYRHDGAGTPNRYGKKYAWIAFYELYGLREDLGVFKNVKNKWLYEGPRPHEADIDPSFPLAPHKRKMLQDDILGSAIGDSATWVKKGPSPSFQKYLTRVEHDRELGPWILLCAHFTRYRSGWRNGFSLIRAFFVTNQHLAKARRLLRVDKVRSSYLPQVAEARDFFAGEVIWRPDFPYANPEPFEVPVGSKKVRNRPVFKADMSGDGVVRFLLNKDPQWHTEPVLDAFGMESPVQDCAFSGRSAFEHPTRTVPSRQLCEHFGLWLRLPSWDTYDSTGNRASIATGFGDVGNYETTVYIRRDLLDRYLADHRLSLIWVVYGERQRLTGRGTSAGYKQYRQLYSWTNGKVQDL
jgi:hypothetical protein